MLTTPYRRVALVTAGFLAGCAAVIAYGAVGHSTSGSVVPHTKQQQFDLFKSQFPSR